jgi:hypothetical protein
LTSGARSATMNPPGRHDRRELSCCSEHRSRQLAFAVWALSVCPAVAPCARPLQVATEAGRFDSYPARAGNAGGLRASWAGRRVSPLGRQAARLHDWRKRHGDKRMPRHLEVLPSLGEQADSRGAGGWRGVSTDFDRDGYWVLCDCPDCDEAYWSRAAQSANDARHEARENEGYEMRTDGDFCNRCAQDGCTDEVSACIDAEAQGGRQTLWSSSHRQHSG